MTDLEKQLAKLKPMPVPSDLRLQVLTACSKVEETRGPSFWNSFWPALYPGHRCTAALGFVWLIILALHMDTPEIGVPSGPSISWAEWQKARVERDFFIAQLETPRFEADFHKGTFSIPREDLKPN